MIPRTCGARRDPVRCLRGDGGDDRAARARGHRPGRSTGRPWPARTARGARLRLPRGGARPRRQPRRARRRALAVRPARHLGGRAPGRGERGAPVPRGRGPRPCRGAPLGQRRLRAAAAAGRRDRPRRGACGVPLGARAPGRRRPGRGRRAGGACRDARRAALPPAARGGVGRRRARRAGGAARPRAGAPGPRARTGRRPRRQPPTRPSGWSARTRTARPRTSCGSACWASSATAPVPRRPSSTAGRCSPRSWAPGRRRRPRRCCARRSLARRRSPHGAADRIAPLSVLVVEGHEFQRRTAVALLRGLGIGAIAEAADGAEALEVIVRTGRPT